MRLEGLLTVTIVLSYIFSSAFLESGLGGRVTFSDLILVSIMPIAALIIWSRGKLEFPFPYRAATPLLAVFLLGALFAVYKERAAFELLVICFSFVGGIALINLITGLSDAEARVLAKGYVLTIGLVSLLCLIDFFVLPGLLSSRQLGGLQGPFRNTGQAGSFFGVHCVLVMAMLLSGLAKRTLLTLVSAVLVFLALVFTLKRAAIVGVVSGTLFLALFLMVSPSARDKKIGISFVSAMSIIGGLLFFIFDWALDNIPGLRWRLEYKFSAEVVDGLSTGFLAENVRSSLAAFSDRPLVGVGLGNVQDVYQSHEIHSTYFGILAYGGVLGVIAYLVFMLSIIRVMFSMGRNKLKSEWAAFNYFLLPLFFGQLISWGYTYHIRKREFWVLLLFVVFASMMYKRAVCASARMPKIER